MSYEKQTWQTGDIVTSAKLNHMEGGIENAQFPAVTISDVGKVLTVEEKSVQGAVLVPEETFVFTDGIMAEINMQNKSLFVEGAECLLTVDGTTITATVQAVSEPDSGLIVQDNETGIVILLEDSTNVSKLYVPNIGTYTVSLYVEGTEYGWAPAEPSGGALFVEVTDTGTTLIINATYNNLVDAITNHIPVYLIESTQVAYAIYILSAIGHPAENDYKVKFTGPEDNFTFASNDPDTNMTLDTDSPMG